MDLRGLQAGLQPVQVLGLLVHGMGDSWRSYEPVVEHLPDDVRVVAPTLRGHGDAGAQIAQLFAVTFPQRTLGLVLVGTPGPMAHHPGVAELDQVFSTLEDPVDPALVRGFTASLFAGPPPTALLDLPVAESLKVPARVIRSTWAGIREFDISSELGRIEVSTLIMWATRTASPWRRGRSKSISSTRLRMPNSSSTPVSATVHIGNDQPGSLKNLPPSRTGSILDPGTLEPQPRHPHSGRSRKVAAWVGLLHRPLRSARSDLSIGRGSPDSWRAR